MRIALVDPSRTVLKIVGGQLEAQGHEVRPFVDGAETLEFIKSDAVVSALITSTELQSMSGMELCWNARMLASRGRPLYVILMSSNYHSRKLIEALDGGADDFMGKPPVAEELYARLRAAERVVSMQRELIRLADTDAMTGVFNRRAFFERAVESCARANDGEPLCGVMMDIDHFKQINDVYGHAVGDRAIVDVARQAGMESPIVGRLGGEEFGILLEGRSLSEAHDWADVVRRNIERLRFDTDREPLSLTCSFGISEWQAGDDIDQLMRRADTALYAAKMRGRNRTVAFDAVMLALNGVRGVVRARRA
jgi:two-component system, cell cycle response regulator